MNDLTQELMKYIYRGQCAAFFSAWQNHVQMEQHAITHAAHGLTLGPPGSEVFRLLVTSTSILVV